MGELAERLKIKTAVYAIFEKEGKILFMRRFNTGWADGQYTVPAGHIDPGETPVECLIRECKEEVNVDVKTDDIEFAHVMYQKDIYIDFYFLVKSWSGAFQINEPNKCDDIRWIDVNDPGERIIDKIRLAIQSYKSNIKFSELEDAK